jgi:hypothetical protein
MAEISDFCLVVVQYISYDIDGAGVFKRGEKAVLPKVVEDRLRPVASVLSKKLGRDRVPCHAAGDECKNRGVMVESRFCKVGKVAQYFRYHPL